MEENVKSFYERAKELAENCNAVKFNNVYETLAEEYNISKRSASDRFKSLFGKNVRDYITYINTPSKEVLRDAIIKCNSHKELLEMLNVKPYWMIGLYDKYFKVSTFKKAKIKLYNEVDIIPYNPTIEDNLSILISQRLGDGSFEFYDNRSSLQLEHGYKQYDYLKFKINLLKKAFPIIPGLEQIKKREYNGYTSYHWRSNNIRNRYMEIIKKTKKCDLIKRLTPFGWLLWYLDDGYMSVSKYSCKLSIAIHDKEVREAAIEELKTYGFNFFNYKESIDISDKLVIVKFVNCFIKPFMHLIPDCMKYKCVVKI